MIRFITSLMVVVILATSGSAQEKTGAKTVPDHVYRVQALYRSGIAQSYEIEEHTSVVRTHSDSGKKSYQRSIKYFATVRATESMDGISNIVVNMDSLRYKFVADGMEVTYDSEMDITPKNFADLNTYIGLSNRTFELTVSPYGEVTAVTGEQIDFWRNYLIENKNDMDSVIYLIWIQSLSEANMLQYGDLQKRVIPGTRVAVDSTWLHDFGLRVDGIVYNGEVESKFAQYTGGVFVLETTDTIQAAPQRIHAYGIPYISNLLEGEAAVQHTVELTNTGTINNVTSNVNAWYRAGVLNEIYTHHIKSNTTWKLTAQYMW